MNSIKLLFSNFLSKLQTLNNIAWNCWFKVYFVVWLSVVAGLICFALGFIPPMNWSTIWCWGLAGFNWWIAWNNFKDIRRFAAIRENWKNERNS